MKPGPKNLPKDVTDKLVQWIIDGDPKTHLQIRDYARKLTEENGFHVFTDQGPSIKWLAGFYRRHPELSEYTINRSHKADFHSDSTVTDSVSNSFLDNYNNYDEQQVDQNWEDDITIEPETKYQIQHDLLVHHRQDPLSNIVDSSQGSSSISTESPYLAGLRILGPELIEEFEKTNFLEQLDYKRKLYEMYMMLKTKEEEKIQSISVPVNNRADHKNSQSIVQKRPFSTISDIYLNIKQEKQKEE